MLLRACPILLLLTSVSVQGWGQDAATPQPSAGSQEQPAPPDPPRPAGSVLFSRELPSDPAGAPANPEAKTPAAEAAQAQPDVLPNEPDPLYVTEAERTSLTFTAYAFDLHLAPATHGLSARVAFTVRNDGPVPLTRLVVQISSSLRWEQLSGRGLGVSLQRLPWVLRRVATDVDHTGWVSEAVATLPEPLPPGASLPLVALYSGAIPRSAERLERIGAPSDQAATADWDAITAPGADSAGTGTALRGFGDVLWYPVSAPPVFLGDGARLFDLVGRTRLRGQAATASLRLAVEFTGDAPSEVFFCGRRQALTAVRDNSDAPIGEATGVATASFEPQPLGFRLPSLFVTDHPSSPVGTAANPALIAATTEHFDALASYAAAAQQVEPLLMEWLGAGPVATLSLLDHAGQPFEDDTLLVRPVRIENASALAPPLAHSLTHAWIHSARPWIDEGLAQFMVLLWTERTAGRQAVVDQLREAALTVALAEPDTQSAPITERKPPIGATSSSALIEDTPNAGAGDPGKAAGQPLVAASSDVFFRTKAAAVWWMLRALAGDDALKQALQAYRRDGRADLQPAGFERTLERTSHQDLRWFFDDWVYRDRGLPDLTVVNVTPRRLEGTGRSGGWLVSVEVRNDGDCVADVPVTVRSAPGAKGTAAASETQRLRIPGHGTVTTRIIFPVPPAEVQVNDGTTPETRVSVHTEHIGAGTP